MDHYRPADKPANQGSPAGAASDVLLHLPMNSGIIRHALAPTLALALQYHLLLRETEPKCEPPTERNTPAIV